MEDWIIWLIIGLVAIFGFLILAIYSKKSAPKVIFSLMTIGAVILTVVVVGPDIDIGEEELPPDVITGASDWRMVSATESQTHVVASGDDDYKILQTFNDTSNLHEGLTQFVDVDFRFQNFGADDGSGVTATVIDYGSFYYDVNENNYAIISKSNKKFNSNWTIDGSTAVNQIDSVTVPSSTQTKTGQVALNLTASPTGVQYWTQSTDTVLTIVEFSNSVTNNVIATITFTWEKTTVTTR